MPVPFSKKNAEFFTLLYPNMNDMLVIEKGEAIGFLCAKTRFIHLNLEHLSELEVRCVGNNKLEFKGLQYYYEQFECKSMPESEVINTDKKCQFDLYSYNIVGFRTETAVIPIYAFCFDSLKMQTAISWHFPLDPTTSMFQEYSTERHPFIKSDDMYNFMDMDAIYAVENQVRHRI